MPQWYSNVEISQFYLENIGPTFVLSPFSVCSSHLSSLICCVYFIKFTRFFVSSIIGWLHRIPYTKDVNKIATISCHSNSLQTGKFVFYLFHMKKLSNHVFFSLVIFNWKQRKKLVLRFTFINLPRASNYKFRRHSIPA